MVRCSRLKCLRPQTLHPITGGMQLKIQTDLIHKLSLLSPRILLRGNDFKYACLFLPLDAGFHTEHALGQLPASAEESLPDSLGSCSVPAPCSRHSTPGSSCGDSETKPLREPWPLGRKPAEVVSRPRGRGPWGWPGKAAWAGLELGPTAHLADRRDRSI